jgi:protein TonB
VIATNWDAHITEVATSGPVGNFAFNSLPAGSYTVEARAGGFAVARMDNLILVNGGTVRADANLVIGAAGERIQVVPPGTQLIARQAAAPVVSSAPIRVGGNLQSAKLIQQVQPVYPPGLQAQGTEGTVVLSAIISKAGVPISLHIQQSAGTDFDEAALKAVQQWRYQSTLLNGEPAEVLTSITVDFKLQP